MPVSGGTYAYGYAYLNPWLGFTAGWMFLCAKVASAATAALGFAGYLHQALGIVVPVAVAAAAVLTAIVVAGIRNSSRTNIFIVSITMLALFFFVIAGSLAVSSAGSQSWQPFLQSNNGGASPGASLLQAAAPMFVAFTGYARIAMLGEEVKERAAPSRGPSSTLSYCQVFSTWPSARWGFQQLDPKAWRARRNPKSHLWSSRQELSTFPAPHGSYPSAP